MLLSVAPGAGMMMEIPVRRGLCLSCLVVRLGSSLHCKLEP